MTAGRPPLDALRARARRPAVLRQRKSAVVAAWRELVYAGFPGEAVGFLRDDPDPFRNPLGHRIRLATERVVDVLVGDAPAEDATVALDAFVRARALQGHGASATLAFVFDLKRAVREVAGPDLGTDDAQGLDEDIDALALLAFDVYVRSREDVHEIRVRAERRRVATLIRRFAPIEEPDPIETEARG